VRWNAGTDCRRAACRSDVADTNRIPSQGHFMLTLHLHRSATLPTPPNQAGRSRTLGSELPMFSRRPAPTERFALRLVAPRHRSCTLAPWTRAEAPFSETSIDG
jgi:hypothetical protein